MTETMLSGRRRATASRLEKASWFWLLHGGGWLAYGAAMLLWGIEHWSLREAALNKAVLVATGFALTLGCRWIYRRARFRRLPPAAFAAAVGAVCFAVAALWIEAHHLLLATIYTAMAGGRLALRPAPLQIGALLYNGFVILAWSLLYLAINAWLELDAQRRRAGRAEALMHQARLRALQAQLEPHFLFNTLNAISTLVIEGQNAAAARMIARLGDYLRLTLDTVETPEIPVAEELEFIRRYLEIEEVRFGERLRVTIDAAPDAMQGLVPALLLQPLVENALQHGVLQRDHGGSVVVSVARRDGVLRLSVTDDGPGLATGQQERRGIGLSNTAARLDTLYGDQSRLRLEAAAGGGLAAIVELPFRAASPPVAAPAAALAAGAGA